MTENPNIPTVPPGEGWAEYRRLVLSELERLDLRLNEYHRENAKQVVACETARAALEKDIELLQGRHAGFATEVEKTYITKSDIKAEVKKIIRQEIESVIDDVQVAKVTGRWEFLAAVATGVFSLIIAIIALAK